MFRSMTGFGRAEASDGRFSVRLEARSVNNRHLKIIAGLPDWCHSFEPDAERMIRGKLSRGTVYLKLEVDETGDALEHEIDTEVLTSYYNRMRELNKELGLNADTRLDTLINLPGCVKRRKHDDSTLKSIWKLTAKALDDALDGLVAMRVREGELVWKEIEDNIKRINEMLVEVENAIPAVLQEYKKRLADRLNDLFSDVRISEQDLHRELAIFAERSNVAEELNRLESHLEQFREASLADDGEPCGRKLEFLTQEMAREANTMASKINNANLVHSAVSIKTEIDKIREQVFNVE